MTFPNFRFRLSFLSSLSLFITVFFLAPVVVYILQFSPSYFSLIRLVLAGGAIAGCAALVLAWLLCRLSERFLGIICSLVFILSILFYFESQVIPFPYGPLDGTVIEWHRFYFFWVLDGLFWLAGIISAIVFRNQIIRVIPRVAPLFIVFQIALAASVFATSPSSFVMPYESVDDTKWSFSREKNIIVLILDTFQSTTFYGLLQRGADIGKLTGFTYFPDCVSGYPTTRGSVPQMMTGNFYMNASPFLEYVGKSLENDSLPKVLRQNGFRCEFYGAPPELNCSNKIISNLVETSLFRWRTNEIGLFEFLGLVRSAPHAFKPFFTWLYYDKWFPHSAEADIHFLKEFKERARVDTDEPVFKYYHLRGVHPPYVMTKEMKRETMEQSYEGYKQQAQGCLRLADSVFDVLKNLGVYDKASILLLGDHGAYSHDPEGLAPGVNGRALPLFLYKPSGADGPLKVSNCPVSLGDTKEILVSEIGVTQDRHGESVSPQSQPHKSSGCSSPKVRRFMDYSWENRYWFKDFLPDMKEFLIDGHAWKSNSWSMSSKIFRAGHIEALKAPERIEFREGGNCREYLISGWSIPEETHLWTDGKIAKLCVPVSDSSRNLKLLLTCTPFIEPKTLPAQRVSILVNSERIAKYEIAQPGTYELRVPSDRIKNGSLDLTIETPDACSPKSLGISEDARTLGLALHELRIEALKAPERIAFREGGNCKEYLISGWSIPEENHLWTDGKIAKLYVPVSDTSRNLKLLLTCTPFVEPKTLPAQRVSILVNSERIATYEIAQPGTYELRIPSDRIKTGSLDLTIETPDACSPKSLGISEDTRTLGLSLHELVIETE